MAYGMIAESADRSNWPLRLLRAIHGEEHLGRALHHFGHAFRRRGGGSLKDERQKQRCLADHRELRRRELAVVDRQIVWSDMCLEVIGKAVVGFLDHVLVEAPS